MCIIIIKQKDKKISKETLKTSAKINPHGLGIVWLDTFEVSYHKSKEYKQLYTERPFIAHFRFATIGKVNKENTHPFQCGKLKDEYLMMNGTIHGLGNLKECDSKVLANNLGNAPRHRWKKILNQYQDVRFVSVNVRTRSFQIYNRELYTYKNGIWYSKDNILQDNLIAVYGTLKKGYSNYHTYLHNSKYIGKGTTQDKYPMIIEGLPYVIDKKGKGKNINVDVFKVSKGSLRNIDSLEGHPQWYRRKEIEVVMKSGSILKCWIYFNPKTYNEGMKTYATYTQGTRQWFNYGGYDIHANTPPYTREIGFKTKQPERESFGFEWDDVQDECTPTMISDSEGEDYYCPLCYGTVEFDSFNNYHCNKCNGWFNESEILEDNI